jgi:two-component system, OmpR family, phosphate regulon sensor histidine kinase PhoR
MFKPLSFRQKVFFSLISIFVVFFLALFPFSDRAVSLMIKRTFLDITADVVDNLKEQEDIPHMIQYLNDQESYIFLFAAILDDKQQPVYAGHPAHPTEKSTDVIPQNFPDIKEALLTGKGYYVGWSPVYQRRFAGVTMKFKYHGHTYFLVLTFPYSQVEVLNEQFQLGIFSIDLFFMILFTLSVWFIFSRLSRPIRDIANSIRSYSLGQTDDFPTIEIDRNMGYEFDYLASTLNSLSEKVRQQISIVVDERNEKEALLESLMEGVIAVDHLGIVRYANQTAAKMLLIPKRQLIGKPFTAEASHPRIDLLQRCQTMLKLAEDQVTVITDSIALQEGQKIYLDLIAVPKPFKSGALIVLQDKSSQYKVVEMGKDFIANASHELRTPITIIKGFAETLQDLPSISPKMLAEITEKIVRNCHRMDTLVKNLLTLSDIENVPETKFHQCDIVALADNCKYLVLTLAPQAEVVIEKSSDCIMADVDPDLIELCLMNLLENGIKYSKPPAHLTIYLKETNDEVVIAIQDKGIGIPLEAIPHIFERFYTVDKARSRKLGGAGLGLSIVRTIIEKHEGSISVASVEGQGTTFTLTLPKSRRKLD